MKKTMTQSEVMNTLEILEEMHPEAGCALDYADNYTLLIAVVLSAQTTDVSVNKVTPNLFKQYPKPADLAVAEQGTVEECIRQIGLYKNKAKNIIALAKVLVDAYGGEVPGDYNELVKLPGVGRKTANVVLAEAFGEQRIAVDTHVFRVSNRIGLTDEDNVVDTEEMLKQQLPHDMWTRTHHLLIFHGRKICKARKPECNNCRLTALCRYFNYNYAEKL